LRLQNPEYIPVRFTLVQGVRNSSYCEVEINELTSSQIEQCTNEPKKTSRVSGTCIKQEKQHLVLSFS